MPRRQRVLDALVRRLLRTPAADEDFLVATGLRVPMRDGTHQLVDHLAPTVSPKGTVLVRSPYGWGTLATALFGTVLAGNGYHVVLARARGTFGSGGDFAPAVHEIEDGADTVAWLREQPWFGGRFATLGASYFGFTQWAILTDPPPELATSIIWAGPHDFRRALYDGDVLNLELALTWSEQMSHQERYAGLVRGAVRGARVVQRVDPALRSLPLADAADAVTGGRWPWFQEWATHRDAPHDYWAPYDASAALDRVEVPVLLAGGWQDVFVHDVLDQYAHLEARGVDVAMTVGPWTHGELISKASPTLFAEALEWLDHHLAGEPLRRASPVRIHTGGTQRWQGLEAWSPRDEGCHLRPGPGGVLAQETGPGDAGPGSVSFTYDPDDPTPSVGGRMLTAARAGFRDDSALARRDDVVVLDTAELAEPLRLDGYAVLTLAHAADGGCDVFVRLSDVAPDGTSTNVTDGYLRRDDAQGPRALTIRLAPTSYELPAGHRLRLLLAGGDFPHHERNLGTGEDPASGTATRRVTHTVDLGGTRLALPATRVVLR